MRKRVSSSTSCLREAGFPAAPSRAELTSPQILPPARRRYLRDAADRRSSGSHAEAGATHTETAPASGPPGPSLPAPPRLALGFGLEDYYLFMGRPSRPGTALCQLNRTVIQSPNGNCSAQGRSVVMSHADKKSTAFRATGKSCVVTIGSVRGHSLLCLGVSLRLSVPAPSIPRETQDGGVTTWGGRGGRRGARVQRGPRHRRQRCRRSRRTKLRGREAGGEGPAPPRAPLVHTRIAGTGCGRGSSARDSWQ